MVAQVLSYLMPFVMILLGVVGLTIYILAVALRESVRQLSNMNELLMVMIGTKEGGADVGRALVASARKPKKDIPGISPPVEKVKKEEQKGLRMTIGAR